MAQRQAHGKESSVQGLMIMDKKNCKWLREQIKVYDLVKATKIMKWADN